MKWNTCVSEDNLIIYDQMVIYQQILKCIKLNYSTIHDQFICPVEYLENIICDFIPNYFVNSCS